MKIQREVIVKPLYNTNSFRARNENIPDTTGMVHQYNPNRKCIIWAKMDKAKNQIKAFEVGEEEKTFMPKIINKDYNDREYLEAVEKFWRNVFIEFQPNPGLVLDISINLYLGKEVDLVVNNKQIKVAVTNETFEKYTKDKPELEYLFGFPVNVHDYWKWRFCLKTSQVANSKKIADEKRGKNMQYYIYNDAEENQTKADTFKVKHEATELYLKHIGNQDMIEGVLRVFEKGNTLKYGGRAFSRIYNVDDLTDIEQKTLFMDIAEELASDFIDIIKDGNLMYKTFARKAVNYGIISNQNGTTIYQFGEDIIAETFTGLVAKLKADKQLYDGIAARIRALQHKSLIEVKDEQKINA